MSLGLGLTLYNSSLVIGAGGGAPFNTKSLLFDGVDDYVIAPLTIASSGGVFPITDSDINLTISLWFKKTANSSIFQWADNLNDGVPFILIQGIAGGYRCHIDGFYRFPGVVAIGEWANVVLIRNSVNNVWTHYLNGISLETYDDGGGLSNRAAGARIYLGNGYNSYFNGFIDEVSIFNTDQSSNIAKLSTAPTEDLTSLSPILWLRNGDGDTYPTITDNGSGGNDGTMTNMDAGDIVSDVPL